MNTGYLLVAIDGTMSSSSSYVGGYDENGLKIKNESYVTKFHRKLKISETDKYFHHGPEQHMGASGWDSSEIYRDAWNWLRLKLRRQPHAKLILVGHSRGGHIVAHMARELAKLKVGAFVEVMRATGPMSSAELARERAKPTQQVYFMGLYDAVDMTTSLGNTDSIPSNVKWCFHAMRSEAVGSRRAWGNTAKRFEKRDAERHFTKEFDATHGAIGGAVPEGCDGELNSDITFNTAAFGLVGYLYTTQVDPSCTVALTQAENFSAGEKANRFIVDGAKSAGLPF